MTEGNSRLIRVWAGLVAGFLLLPLLVVIPMSFNSGRALKFPPDGLSLRWYQELLNDPAWREAAWTSAGVAFWTVVLATTIGTAAALALMRWRSPLKIGAFALILSPMIVPVIVVAVGVFLTYSKWHLAGAFAGLVLGHTILAIPFVVVAVMASARSYDPTLELAAQSLGANRWQTFRRVVLPLIAPGVASGALFAFITSWDEAVVSTFMTSPSVRTLPVLMWTQVRTELDPSLAAIGTLLVLVSTLALAASQLLLRRSRR